LDNNTVINNLYEDGGDLARKKEAVQVLLLFQFLFGVRVQRRLTHEPDHGRDRGNGVRHGLFLHAVQEPCRRHSDVGSGHRRPPVPRGAMDLRGQGHQTEAEKKERGDLGRPACLTGPRLPSPTFCWP
jgi:hypothetical protein